MRSGQVTVTTAGTAVQGPDVDGIMFAFAALASNTNAVYVGADSTHADVSATTGFPLKPGDILAGVKCDNLRELWFDATTNGEKVCWFKQK